MKTKLNTDKIVLYGGDRDGSVTPLALVDQVTVEIVLPRQVQRHAILLHVNLQYSILNSMIIGIHIITNILIIAYHSQLS